MKILSGLFRSLVLSISLMVEMDAAIAENPQKCNINIVLVVKCVLITVCAFY